jgi:hypothetical protein
MTHKNQKRKELHQLNEFRTLRPDFPEGEVAISERPDFVVHNGQTSIGIEVTSIFHEVPASKIPLQVQESEQQLMLNEASNKYSAMNLPHLHVSIFFANETKFNKGNRAHYASVLANLIASNVPQSNGFHSIENDFDSPAKFPFEFHSLHIARFDSQKSSFMHIPMAGWVQEDFSTELQNKMSEKNLLLPNYQKCAAYWLLIVAEWAAPSSFFVPSQKMLSIEYESDFDRVFFMNMFDREASELSLLKGAR